MEKNVLYYKFLPIAEPALVLLWQRELCRRLGLKGRVLISKHGINGTLSGEIENVREYKREMNRSVIFKGIEYKWSDATRGMYPRLSVKVKDEIVNFGVGNQLKVGKRGVVNTGKHLSPEELHRLVEERGDDVVFLDGRNKYEAAVGRFRNALVPNTRTSRDFKKELEKPQYRALKNKPIVTYCTGGVRCEILSSLMKNRGFGEVYQLKGGIVKYGQKYGDDGLWQGKLYVFDGRVVSGFTDKAIDIGTCVHCMAKTSRYINCANLACNDQILVCDSCNQNHGRSFCARAECNEGPALLTKKSGVKGKV